MKSGRTKVMHEVGGLPLVRHVVKTAIAAGSSRIALVTGRGAEAVETAAGKDVPDLGVYLQNERLGTAHAALAAREALAEGFDDVLVLFGDTPLLQVETLRRARDALANGAQICVIGFRTPNPTGYGRIIENGGNVIAVREEKDASEDEKRITFCNGGAMAIDGAAALALLQAVGNENAKREYYLTDIIQIARKTGANVAAIEASYEEVLGVNTRAELAGVEAIWQRQRRLDAMLAGTTLIAPETVFFSFDTKLGIDVLVEPNVVFGPGVTIADGAVIHAFCHVEGASIGENAIVGPFARLRPGTELGTDAKIGNFCETKNARIETSAKINHLTYIGDARVGAGSNIGAGTITCNYDGANKWFTEIGTNVFVGSNSSLVAPVRIGDGAYVGSGSVVTDDVPSDSLAIARARQVVKEGRATSIREKIAGIKSGNSRK